MKPSRMMVPTRELPEVLSSVHACRKQMMIACLVRANLRCTARCAIYYYYQFLCGMNNNMGISRIHQCARCEHTELVINLLRDEQNFRAQRTCNGQP